MGKIKKEVDIIEKELECPPSWGSKEEKIKRYKDLELRHAELLKIQETMWR